jgi:serine/threonine-protein kinase PpkA
MGSVFLAVQESLDRQVALKVLNNPESQEFTERFINEGRIVASMSHRSIITVHDIGLYDGHLYISMEYIEGGDLRARIKEGMRPSDALDILKTVGGALEIAHKKGVVHRDVKPANILYRTDGTPLLADFGIARDFERDEEITVDGGMMGSPHYLPPEQARSPMVDGRADIYSLGIIFYEMLTGEKPFSGESPFHIVFQHLREPVPDLPEELARFQPLVEKLTAKDPDDRFANAGELQTAVMELQVNQALGRLEKREGAKPAKRKKKRGGLRRVASAAFATVLLSVAATSLFAKKDTLLPYVKSLTSNQAVRVHEREEVVNFIERAVKYLSWTSKAPEKADGTGCTPGDRGCSVAPR